MSSEQKYPEHEKLQAIKEQSQIIGEFLEWLAVEKQVSLCKVDPEYRGDYSPYWPIRKRYEELLAEFFNIDLEVLEEEKRTMLEEMQEQTT